MSALRGSRCDAKIVAVEGEWKGPPSSGAGTTFVASSLSAKVSGSGASREREILAQGVPRIGLPHHYAPERRMPLKSYAHKVVGLAFVPVGALENAAQRRQRGAGGIGAHADQAHVFLFGMGIKMVDRAESGRGIRPHVDRRNVLERAEVAGIPQSFCGLDEMLGRAVESERGIGGFSGL